MCAFQLNAMPRMSERFSPLSQVARLQPDAAFKGRVISLREPKDGDSLPVGSTGGVAVIDEGPFAGQRVEFERAQCYVFGYAMGRADLAQVVKFGKSKEKTHCR